MPIQPRPVSVPKINLLPRDPFYDTLIGKIMVWSIQVGRYIIVFTEIIVIMSFASRFKLDRDLTDLTAEVTQKKSIVASFGDVETRTRKVQEKISTVSKLISEKNAVYYFEKLTKRIPAGVELTQMTFQPGSLSFTGKANNSGVLAGLIVALKQEPEFTVSVDRINSAGGNDPSVDFSMKIEIPGAQETKNQPVQAVKGEPAPEL